MQGIPNHQLKEAVEQTLHDVQLTSKADSKSDDLSGGQKRKLSIGIALIGDPKIVFLDEPTAGIDAVSRRNLWSILKRRKAGKVILLTTHFMDEADILADRKAVISKGTLRCCGSSSFLKNKFGVGYHLTLITPPSVATPAVTELVQTVVPGAQLSRHYGKEVSITLPTESVDNFSELFELLSAHKGIGGDVSIEDYGISMTTLEEVFLRLNEEDEMVGSSFEAPGTNKPKAFAIEEVEVEYNVWRSFRHLLVTRFKTLLREPAAIVFLLIFTIGFTAGSMAVINTQPIGEPSEQYSITFDPDRSMTLLVHSDSGNPLSSLINMTSLTGVDYNGE